MTAYILTLLVIMAVSAAGYRFWSKRVMREIAEGAETSWSRLQRDEPTILSGVSREQYEQIYRRSHFPRFPKYALVTIISFVALLPVFFGVLSGFLWGADKLGLIAEPAELAKYVPIGEAKTNAGQAEREEMALYLAKDYAGFYYFFGVIAGWIAIVAIAMRRYHARRPGDVRDELIRRRMDEE